MGSQPGGGTETPLKDWAATAAIIVGATLDAAAIITGLLVMGIIGAILLFGGIVYVLVSGMLERVEEYGSNREDVG